MMRSRIQLGLVLLAAVSVQGQPVPIVTSYTQSFDSMGTASVPPPLGWSVWSLAGGSSTFASSIPAAGIGGGTQLSPSGLLTVFTQGGSAAPAASINGLNAGFAVGPPPSNRSLGTSPTGVAASAVQLWLSNQSAGPIPAMSVDYSMRVLSAWGSNELPGYSVFFSTVGPSGPFVAAPALTTRAVTTDATGTVIHAVGTIVFNAPVGIGGEVWIRWVDDNSQVGSPDQAFAIDDVTIAPVTIEAGACCDGVAGCTLAVDAPSCAGVFLGLNTACAPNPCAPPTGSCCDGAGGCLVTTANTCTAGHWARDATCGPNSCAAPGKVRFAVIGDYGVDNDNQLAVSRIVKAHHPQFIATVGDNTYFTNADITNWDRTQAKYYGEFIRLPIASAYVGEGATTNHFFPVMGNHDWDVGGSAASYSAYFDLPGNERYYRLSSGPVDLFMLSSDPREPDSNAAGGVQHAWFVSELAASSAEWKLAFFHHPARTTTTGHAPSAAMQGWNFQSVGIHAVLQGHNHQSERIESGIPWFVCGAGGNALYSVNVLDPESVFLDVNSFMFLLVDADATSILFRFIDTAGTVRDTRVIERDGACCTGTLCSVVSRSACLGNGGTFQGAGTACEAPGNPRTCCPANFNGTGGLTVQDIFDFLQAYFAGCP